MGYRGRSTRDSSKCSHEGDPKISVVIPVLNDQARIKDCLKAVFNQTLSPYEVIVVDGHSTDNTVRNARTFPVRVVFEDFGTVGGARQVGVEDAGGDYIAFTDSDCIPQKDWLENLVREFDDGIVGVGGGIKNIGTGIWEESIALALDTFLGSANSVQDRVLKGKRIVKSISGCNSMYRKKDIVEAGGFDVHLSINEDTELNKRLQSIGKIFYTPDALIHHNQARTLPAFVQRMVFFGYGRGVNRLWDLQVVPPVMAVGILLMVLIAPLISIAMVGIYALIVIGYTLAISTRTRKLNYLVSVPVVYILEHTAYMFGFWKGTIASITVGSTS